MKLLKYIDYINESNDLSYLMDFFKLKTEKEVIERINNSTGFVAHGISLDSLPDRIELFKYWEKIEAVKNNIKSIPEGIGKLEYLEIINLTNNKIEKLPDSIGDLKQLNELILEKNKIEKLPESITKIKTLKKLNLRDNKIEKLPDFLEEIDLIDIDLTMNELKELPNLSGLKKLKYLNLMSNKITSIPDSIKELTNLKILTLAFNPIQKNKEEISRLKDLLPNCKIHI